MTADAQARGVEDHLPTCKLREPIKTSLIYNADGKAVGHYLESDISLRSLVCTCGYESGFKAGHRAAEEKAAKVTRAAVVEELKALVPLACYWCRTGVALHGGETEYHVSPQSPEWSGHRCDAGYIHARIAVLEAQAAEPETGGER